MKDDWPQIKARLEERARTGGAWTVDGQIMGPMVDLDIRAALQRVEACEAAFKRQGELLAQARQDALAAAKGEDR